MKKTIITTLLALAGLVAQAQSSFEIKYDAAGNRIQRKVITLNPLRKGEIQSEKDTQGAYTFELSPNPTSAALNIYAPKEFLDMEDKKIYIHDLMGKELKQSAVHDGNISLDFSSFPTGTYIVRLTARDYSSEWKVVKM